jgi:ATP-binding cassette, subfamily B, bacterial
MQSILQRIQGALRLDQAIRLIWQSDPKKTTVSFVLILLSGFAPTVSLYLIKEIVDAVVSAIGIGTQDPAIDAIIALVGAAGGVAIAAAIIQAIAGYLENEQSLRVVDHVQTKIDEKSIELDLAYYEDPKYHDTLHRAQEEAPYRPGKVLSDVFAFAENAVILIGISVLLAVTFHWAFVLMLLVTAVPIILIRLAYARRFFQWDKEMTSAERKVDYLNFLLTGSWYAKDIRAYSLGELFLNRSKEVRGELRTGRLEIIRGRTTVDLIARISQTAVLFALIGYVVIRVVNNRQSIGDIILIYQAFQRGQSAINGLMSSIGDLYENNLFLSYYSELMSLESRVKESESPIRIAVPIKRGLELKQVSFRYPGKSAYAAHDITLSAGVGEIVAIAGENGAGKSTLIRLITRLHDPSSGTIEIDGVDIRRVETQQLRELVGVLFQEPSSFYMPAGENIWFGDTSRGIDQREIADAATHSGADSIIEELPRKYDTVLGPWFDDGVELSTGQWKKIALARIFYGNKQILLFDEPTDALDAFSEKRLLTTLQENRGSNIVIIVSHRMSTVMRADRVYILEGGQVVQSGSPASLRGERGPFQTLCENQGVM